MPKILMIGEQEYTEELITINNILKMYTTIHMDFIDNREIYNRNLIDYDLLILWFSLSPNIENIRNITNVNSKVLVISSNYTQSEMIDILNMPVRGMIIHDFKIKELLYNIELILDGGYCFSNDAIEYLLHKHHSSSIIDQRPTDLLTRREWEILENVAKGLKNEQVAEALSLSKGTVSMYMNKIINKLEVKNKAGAIALALRNRWISVE